MMHPTVERLLSSLLGVQRPERRQRRPQAHSTACDTCRARSARARAERRREAMRYVVILLAVLTVMAANWLASRLP